ncbi:MAG: T9SS type A sorting domain-containing protein, partial [Chitinophagaceae bacterium]|nr:T9SS type A sorting domain-containing protein [Chitinophagaceae bacterium]
KSGVKNILKWTTTNEQQNVGFEVQRSTDGVNYSNIGFVNTLAPGGYSNGELNYTFEDNSPATTRKSYYRLNQKDIDGRGKLSKFVLINGEKPFTIAISGVFPNPATTQISLVIDAPKREDIGLVIMDVMGRIVKQQKVNVEIGSNVITVETANLAKGSYLVKLVSGADAEAAVGKFIKQ